MQFLRFIKRKTFIAWHHFQIQYCEKEKNAVTRKDRSKRLCSRKGRSHANQYTFQMIYSGEFPAIHLNGRCNVFKVATKRGSFSKLSIIRHAQ